jgi:hypothetical protein
VNLDLASREGPHQEKRSYDRFGIDRSSKAPLDDVEPKIDEDMRWGATVRPTLHLNLMHKAK